MKATNFRATWVAALMLTVIVLPAVATQSTLTRSSLLLNSLQQAGPRPYVSGELLIRFKDGSSLQSQERAVGRLGLQKIRTLTDSGWVHVRLPSGLTVEQALSAYARDSTVDSVQPNYVYHSLAAPNDPRYAELWALKNTGQTIVTGTYPVSTGSLGSDLNIEAAWDHVTDCSSVVVAVIDSGVNYQQEDLAANMWDGGGTYPNHGYDFVDGDDDPMDLSGHGTHVAATIGAMGNNSVGVTGVCWTARIMAVRVLSAAGGGTTASIVQGIDFAVANGATVINMSLGGAVPFDSAFSSAISDARAADVAVIVAAGNGGADGVGDNNDGTGNAFYPCNFTHANLVCVAALDQNYDLASFSNWGTTSVDVGAPGTNIVSAWAGTESLLTDDFDSNNDGTLDWTTSGGWGYRGDLTLAGIPVDLLVNPADFPDGVYANSADQRVYKQFDLSGADAAILSFFTQFAVQPNDFFEVNYRSDGGDPFAGGVVLGFGNGDTGGVVGPLSYDISPCIGATCAVGFRLQSDGSGVDLGVGVLEFSIATLQLNPGSYSTASGTSMASPHVAGVAAMLRAYNPDYTYADVVSALRNGGRSLASLSGRTTTGRSVDAMRTLAYINRPSGVTASVQ